MTKNRLNKSCIENKLKTGLIGRDLHFFDKCTSTFDVSKSLNLKHGSVICALRQSKGRGRLGRQWASDKGGIYVSVILKPAIAADKLHQMTAICAVAVQRAISVCLPCYIKWPNDIVSDEGMKLCGILTKAAIDKEAFINVGIGINANTENFDSELKYASSIKRILGREIDENELLCRLLSEIENVSESNDYAVIMDEFKAKCINIGRDVRVLGADGRELFCGRCTDIADDGELIITKEDGDTQKVSSGEVSVRGIYGEAYV